MLHKVLGSGFQGFQWKAEGQIVGLSGQVVQGGGLRLAHFSETDSEDVPSHSLEPKPTT